MRIGMPESANEAPEDKSCVPGQAFLSPYKLIDISEGPLHAQTSNALRALSFVQPVPASVQSSSHSAACHHQIVNNQMAQLHLLQQEHMREKEQRQQIRIQ